MYIVLKGIVGSGKSTQVKKLVEYFRGEGKSVTHVREPGSTPIAEDIRYLAQGKSWEREEMHPLTNAYLYAAARAQTLETIVRPALERGDVVISDRSFLSSCAIQGEAQGIGIERVLDINKEAIGDILPDIILYMDIDLDTALSRTFDSAGDKWESLDRSFFEGVIRGYEKYEKLEILKDRWVNIDASGSEEEVFQAIIQSLK